MKRIASYHGIQEQSFRPVIALLLRDVLREIVKEGQSENVVIFPGRKTPFAKTFAKVSNIKTLHVLVENESDRLFQGSLFRTDDGLLDKVVILNVDDYRGTFDRLIAPFGLQADMLASSSAEEDFWTWVEMHRSENANIESFEWGPTMYPPEMTTLPGISAEVKTTNLLVPRLRSQGVSCIAEHTYSYDTVHTREELVRDTASLGSQSTVVRDYLSENLIDSFAVRSSIVHRRYQGL